MLTSGILLPLSDVLFTISLSPRSLFILNPSGICVFFTADETSPSTKKKFVLNLPLRKELNPEVFFCCCYDGCRIVIGVMLLWEE